MFFPEMQELIYEFPTFGELCHFQVIVNNNSTENQSRKLENTELIDVYSNCIMLGRETFMPFYI